MGRKLMRVPLDFDWPLNKTWGGYLNPFYAQRTDCPACAGSGYAPEAKRFKDQWYGYAPFDPVAYGVSQLAVDHPAVVEFARRNVERHPDYYGTGEPAVARECKRLWENWKGQWSHHLNQDDIDALVQAGRLHDFVRRPRTPEQAQELAKDGGYWLREPNGYRPTPEEVNSWAITSFGHDAINCWVCVAARCKREGFKEYCSKCEGSGDLWVSDGARVACEDWEPSGPPNGPGYQLWETTSEGSPVSPVFQTLEALCDWCADNATTFGSYTATSEKWREMLDSDFVVHREGSAVFL